MSPFPAPRRTHCVALLLLLSCVAALATGPGDTAPTAPDGPALAPPLERLKSNDEKTGAAAARDLTTLGRPAAPALVRTLGDPDNAARARAATVLRDLLAADPGARTNDHGRSYWADRVLQTRPAMKKAKVLELLPPDPASKAGGAAELPSVGDGDSHSSVFRLDDYWTVAVTFRNPDTLIGTPTLTEGANAVYVAAPANYTGDWANWYVNGQKSSEIQYRNGVYHGTFTTYFDNGSRSVEQHYVNGHANGPDTGWYRNGRKSYEGRYENDRQVGTWTHWYEDGNPGQISTYRAGKRDGASTTFFPDGHKQYELNYTNGARDGTDTAWDETGKILWARRFEMGKMVE